MNKIFTYLNSTKVLVLADQAAFSGSTFLLTLLLARICSPEHFGVYSSIVLFFFLLNSITNALIIQPFQVNIAKVDHQKGYISFVLLANTALILAFMLVSRFIAKLPIDALQLISDKSGFVSLWGIGFLLLDAFRKIFLALNNVKAALIIDLLAGISQVFPFLGIYLYSSIELHQVYQYLSLSYIPALSVGLILFYPYLSFKIDVKKFIAIHQKEGSWLLMTGVLQWWSNNLFVVASGVFLGAQALGAFRLVQSLFGVLNLIFQTFENHALPQAARLYTTSVNASIQYLKQLSIRGSMAIGLLLVALFIFSDTIIVVAGGEQYGPYGYVIKGMAVLYAIIFIGYPIRMGIRIHVASNVFFNGYLISFILSASTFNFLLSRYELWGALIGLMMNQAIMLAYWQYVLQKKQFVLWK